MPHHPIPHIRIIVSALLLLYPLHILRAAACGVLVARALLGGDLARGAVRFGAAVAAGVVVVVVDGGGWGGHAAAHLEWCMLGCWGVLRGWLIGVF